MTGTRGPQDRASRAVALCAAACLLFAGCSLAPEPVTDREVDARVAGDLTAMFGGQEPVTAPLTLADAAARAVKYNLEHRVKLVEAALAQNVSDLSVYDLLPAVNGSAGYARKNPSNISSADLNNPWSFSLSASWNILDFGVSYVRARQDGNRVQVAEERRRRTLQTTVQDVRSAFWRAARAERLAADLDQLRRRHETARAAIHASLTETLKSPVELLDTEKSILTTVRELETLQREVVTARSELASLMNMPPGQPFRLASPEGGAAPQTALPPLPELEREALRRRPELREEDYQARISADEVRKQMLRMLPGIELSASADNANNNAFTWSQLASKLTTTLISLVSGPASIHMAEVQEQAGDLRRLALGVTVLTQTDIAFIRVTQARQDYQTALTLSGIEDELLRHARAAHKAGSVSMLELVRRESDHLLAETRRDFADNALRAAIGTLMVSVGLDPPLPAEAMSADLATLSRTLGPMVQADDVKLWLDRARSERAPDPATAAGAGS